MGNRYGHEGVPVPWDTIKALWCSDKKNTKEIAAIFGVVANTIETRATREGWRPLRDKARRARFAAPAQLETPASPPAAPLRASEPAAQKGKGPAAFGPEISNRPLTDSEIVKRAVEIAGSSKFRERVIAANEKALKVLEESPPASVGEADRFAEALTKVERIGARTYGYDRETERPIVNIGVLTSGLAEYEL